MARKAKTIELTTDGQFITSATVVGDSPADVETSGSSFDLEASEAAVAILRSTGSVKVSGIVAATKTRQRFATQLAKAFENQILEGSADIPRPKSAAEVMAENIDEILSLMAEGLTKEEAISAVMGS